MIVVLEVDAFGVDLGLAVVRVEFGVRLAVAGVRRDARRGDVAVVERELGDLVQIAAARADVLRLAVVVVRALDQDAGEIELVALVRLPLQRRLDAVALARLLEVRAVDADGKLRGRNVSATIHGRSTGNAGAGGVAEEFDARACEVFLVVGGGHEETEGLIAVLPAPQSRGTRIAVAGAVVVAVADRAAHGVVRQIQRLARMDDHGAADAALVDACFRRFVYFHQADDFRRQQGVVEGTPARVRRVAAPVARGNGLAVEQNAVERGIGAVDADLLAFAELPVHGDAGQMRERLRGVGVGEFADVHRADRVDHRVRVALDVERPLQAAAVAGDGHRLHLLRVLGLGFLFRAVFLVGGGLRRASCGSGVLSVGDRRQLKSTKNTCVQNRFLNLHFPIPHSRVGFPAARRPTRSWRSLALRRLGRLCTVFLFINKFRFHICFRSILKNLQHIFCGEATNGAPRPMKAGRRRS